MSHNVNHHGKIHEFYHTQDNRNGISLLKPLISLRIPSIDSKLTSKSSTIMYTTVTHGICSLVVHKHTTPKKKISTHMVQGQWQHLLPSPKLISQPFHSPIHKNSKGSSEKNPRLILHATGKITICKVAFHK